MLRLISRHNSRLFISLLVSQNFYKLNEVLFEALKDPVAVFDRSVMVVERLHALWNDLCGDHTTGRVVVISNSQAKLRRKLHRFWELLDQLVEHIFGARCRGVVYKDQTMSVLLNGSPTFLILEVTGDIPQLQSKLPVARH